MLDDADQTLTGVRGPANIRPGPLDDTVQGDNPAAAPGELSRGDCVGRYLILRRLGAGAMGVVYAANDPELNREVAVKLLHLSNDHPEARARMLREAQSLARLAHPNVVAVHDVGIDSDRVYLTMEYVRGRTLRAWLAEEAPDWKRALAVLIDAAHGLVAAHQTGLVHRDFKPDNVMVGDDGRVRVMDFGLARDADGVASPARRVDSTQGSPTASISAEGTVSGTPAYLSAEQWHGHRATAASDQFAFCTTAWEALTGRRPFRGESIGQLCEAITEGKIAEHPATASLPGWLERILVRGLSVDPEARWPSMQNLVEAIGSRLRRRRRARWTVALAGVGVGAIGASQAGAWSEQRRVALCREGADGVAETWNDARRDALAARMRAGGASYADASFQTVAEHLDTWSAAWQRANEDACTLPVSALRAAAVSCFADHRDRLGALLDALTEPSGSPVAAAVDVVNALPDPSRCANAGWLSARPVLPAEHRPQALAVWQTLAHVEVLRRGGDAAVANEAATQALTMAESIGFPPLTAEARLATAATLDSLGELDASIEAFAQTYADAARAGAPEQEADAARELAYAYSEHRRNAAAARSWASASEAALGAQTESDRRRRARLVVTRAIIASNAGEHRLALDTYADALALNIETAGPDHPSVGAIHANLAGVYEAFGDPEQSEASAERAVEVFEAAYGATHPSVGGALLRLAAAQSSSGRPNQALPHARRALQIAEESGTGELQIALAHNLVGMCLSQLEHYAAAADAYRKTLAVTTEVLGAEHPFTNSAMHNLATVYDDLGEPEKSAELFEKTIEIRLADGGPTDAQAAQAMTSLAITFENMGKADAAEKQYLRSIAILRAQDPPRNDLLLDALVKYGGLAVSEGRGTQAQALLSEALEVDDGEPATLRWRIKAKFGLAKAHVLGPNPSAADQQQSLQLANAALALAEQGDQAKLADEITEWIRAQTDPPSP